jgi:L-xylulose reductase
MNLCCESEEQLDQVFTTKSELIEKASQAALADHVVYGMTKASLDMLTKIMALELGPLGIRTNAVNPTVVMTAMAKVGWSDPAKAGPMLAKIPLGRFAEVEDVVGPVLYLLSGNSFKIIPLSNLILDLSAMVTGVTHPIDGGFLAQ